MAAEQEKSILENIVDIANPEITTVVEFDTPSIMTLGAVLLVVIIIAVIAWALARKLSHQ